MLLIIKTTGATIIPSDTTLSYITNSTIDNNNLLPPPLSSSSSSSSSTYQHQHYNYIHNHGPSIMFGATPIALQVPILQASSAVIPGGFLFFCLSFAYLCFCFY